MADTWHRIDGGVIVQTERQELPKEGIATGDDGFPVWRIQVNDTPPVEGVDYDKETQAVVEELQIQDTQVFRTWTVRALTAQEISDRDSDRLARWDRSFDEQWQKGFQRAAFEVNNQVRTLNAQAVWTPQEYKDWVRSLASA